MNITNWPEAFTYVGCAFTIAITIVFYSMFRWG